MRRYIADTNFYLRFILQDNKDQAVIAEKRIDEAKSGKISILFPDEVILEMEFVLRSYYSVLKKDIVENLLSLIKMKYVDIENRALWIKTIEIYKNKNVSLLDIFLFIKARNFDAEVLSFDKDFRKLERLAKEN